MKILKHPDAQHPFARPARVALATLALTVASSASIVGAGEVAAHASGTYQPITSMMDWLDVGIRGGSTTAGTDAIQWWADGGVEQQWATDGYANWPSGVFDFVNENSGMCLTTDGVAGDPLTQQPCSSNDVFQQWESTEEYFQGGWFLTNPITGLNMDVQGVSYWGGAEIDAWYPNGQQNQVFWY